MAENPVSRINWVDIITVILLIRMGYMGFRLGLSAELIKGLATVGGLCTGFRYYQGFGDQVARWSFLGIEWAAAVVMLGLAALVYLVLTWLFRRVEGLMQISFESHLSQLGGLSVGLVRALLVVSVVLVACMQLPSSTLQESIQKHSLTGSRVVRMAPAVYDSIMGFVKRLRD